MSQTANGKLHYGNFDFYEGDNGLIIAADMTSHVQGATFSINGAVIPSRTEEGHPNIRVAAPITDDMSPDELACGRRYFERLISPCDPQRLPGMYIAAARVAISYNPTFPMNDVFLDQLGRTGLTMICEYPEPPPKIMMNQPVAN